MQYLKLSLLVFIISCTSYQRSYKRIDLSDLVLGSSKKQVIATLGKQPDNMIGAKAYPDGTMEVLQFSKHDPWYGALQERYWLYFWNDSLRQWGRPGDWEKEADRIYEIRYR